MKHVLLAVDETEASGRAAEFVGRFFTGPDVSITALNVARLPSSPAPPTGYWWVPPVPYGGLYAWPWSGTRTEGPADEALRREEQAGRAVAATQAPPGAEAEVAFGDPVDAIEAAADDNDADLIVVGSNEKGLFARWFGQSVSEELAKDPPRPVLVVG